MNLIWQGILLGLGLSVLVGPLIFLYIQVGIQFGFRSAFFLGLGAWMSDLMFILIIYFQSTISVSKKDLLLVVSKE